MALLPEEMLESLRQIVNTVWNPKAGVLEAWKIRLINPIPKIQGNYELEKMRPIALLDVIQKGFWAIVITRINKVWEQNNILHPQQYGSRKKKQASSATLLATLLAEEAEATQEN